MGIYLNQRNDGFQSARYSEIYIDKTTWLSVQIQS